MQTNKKMINNKAKKVVTNYLLQNQQSLEQKQIGVVFIFNESKI